MEDFKDFEKFLFCDQKYSKWFDIIDVDFWVDRIIQLLSLRPLWIDRVHNLCQKYCENPEFREKLIEKSFNQCPVLLYRLFRSNVYFFQEIKPLVLNTRSVIPCYYFRKEFEDFEQLIRNKHKPWGLESLLSAAKDLDSLLEFGFIPNSTEYCLKYDDITVLRDQDRLDSNYLKWSPFEWSREPNSLELLVFSGYFGSIKCFKYLLLNGFSIDLNVKKSVICGGNIDLFHLCIDFIPNVTPYICLASEFFHLPLIEYLLDKGIDINGGSSGECIPLHYAAKKGHYSIAELLVQHGSQINSKSYENSMQTPLHCAADSGNLIVVRYLVQQGANVNELDLS